MFMLLVSPRTYRTYCDMHEMNVTFTSMLTVNENERNTVKQIVDSH